MATTGVEEGVDFLRAVGRGIEEAGTTFDNVTPELRLAYRAVHLWLAWAGADQADRILNAHAATAALEQIESLSIFNEEESGIGEEGVYTVFEGSQIEASFPATEGGWQMALAYRDDTLAK